MDESKNVVPFDVIPQIHTGSFLTKEQAEQFKEAFKDLTVVVRCKDCTQNNQCSIQFKFADADNPGEWFCAYGKRR